MLGIILTVQLMVVLDATIVNIALPKIATALNFSTASLSTQSPVARVREVPQAVESFPQPLFS